MSHPETKSDVPNEECIARGAKYFFQIDRGPAARANRNRSGHVYDEHRSVRWRYDVRESSAGSRRGNPFNKPDFVFAETDGGGELVIRRVSFLPSFFEIRDQDALIGRIGMRSIFRIKYSIEIEGTGSWTFRLPLFTVRFRGESQSDTDIWVVVGPSKMDWSVLIRPGVNDRRLVPALAFIHNEWWNYS